MPPRGCECSPHNLKHSQQWLDMDWSQLPEFASFGFPGGSVVKNPPAKQEMWARSLGQEDALEKEMATHSIILVWRIPWTEKPGQATIHGFTKSWTWLSTAQHGTGLGRVCNFMQNHKLPYLLFLQCPNSPTFLLLSPENTFLVNHWHSKFLAQNLHHRNLISNSWYMKQS